MTMDEASRLIRQSNFGAKADEILRALKPSIAISADRENPVGHSYLGGVPETPKGFAWPTKGGKPLSFLGQIHLPDVAPFDQERVLPSTGALWFFYDVDEMVWGFDPCDASSWCVIYDEVAETTFRELTPPGGTTAFPRSGITFKTIASLPSWDWENKGFEIADCESDAWNSLYSQITYFAAGGHRLLGYPNTIQSDMRLECETSSTGTSVNELWRPNGGPTATLHPAAAEWRLLLELDSDENGPAWTWGDAGRIYFMIRHADLIGRAFEKAWLVFQCY